MSKLTEEEWETIRRVTKKAAAAEAWAEAAAAEAAEAWAEAAAEAWAEAAAEEAAAAKAAAEAWAEAKAAAEAALAEKSEEYELIGRILGTYGGRWVFIPDNKHLAWPDGTAVYVRRIKK
jgi:hypothetical protein